MSSISTYYIKSLPIEPNKYGSKNDTPIKAIGVFNFDINELSEFEFISLTFPNHVDNRIEEVVITSAELRNRLQSRDNCPSNLLVLWLMPDGYLYNTTNIGAEGEWWFVSGGMAKDTILDYTLYLNNSKLPN